INHWDRLGIAQPSLQPADGPGSRRLYALGDLAAVEYARRLRTTKLGLGRVGHAVEGLRRIWPDGGEIAAGTVIVVRADGRCQPFTGEGSLADALAGDPVGLIFNLEVVIRDLQRRLAEPPPPKMRRPRKRAQTPRASSWGEDW
ncbi:MAG: hypothetical protein GY842_21335, partial [bacterium]|nr:hypothetical protein [bacterium]